MDPDDKNSLVFRNDTDSEQFEKVYLYSIQNPVEVCFLFSSITFIG